MYLSTLILFAMRSGSRLDLLENVPQKNPWVCWVGYFLHERVLKIVLEAFNVSAGW